MSTRADLVWAKRAELPTIEFEHWRGLRPENDDGAVKLNRCTSMELALPHPIEALRCE